MLYRFVGLQHYDFIDKDGKSVIGNKLHVLDERGDLAGFELGYKVDKLSINDDLKAKLLALLPDPKQLVNKQLNIEFNSYGRVERISLVK